MVGIGKKLQRERLTHGGLDDISNRHGDIVSQRRKTTNQHVVTLPKQLRGEERSAYQVTSLRMLIQQACQKRVFFICVFNKIIFYRKVIQMKEKICKEGNNSNILIAVLLTELGSAVKKIQKLHKKYFAHRLNLK